jgi:ABC-type nitrate/sulfonate/bicarbonate transport system substrate-binding protein
MTEYQPIELRGFFRAYSHLPVWAILDEAGIWKQVGVKVSFEFCDSSTEAERALYDGSIDFISGNHISPYGHVAGGKPIVSLASPSNSVRDNLVSRASMKSVAELKGGRIADATVLGPEGEYHHPRGNHMLYVKRAGLGLDQVEWLEVEGSSGDSLRSAQLAAVKDGKADAAFITGGVEESKKAGLHLLRLDPLPMVNGPTLTTTVMSLQRKDRLGERLVKALLMGIHFAHTRREETEQILEGLRKRVPEARSVSYNGVAKLAQKPYPALEAVNNAYELCCMVAPETKEVSPLALWDLHYLRELDDTGFIDGLYR